MNIASWVLIISIYGASGGGSYIESINGFYQEECKQSALTYNNMVGPGKLRYKNQFAVCVDTGRPIND